MIFDDDLNWLEWFALILIVLAIVHSIGWLITKGIIWIAYGLFNVNWYSKFWYVYVMIFILTSIFNFGGYKRKSK